MNLQFIIMRSIGKMARFNKNLCTAVFLLCMTILMMGCSSERKPDDIGSLFTIIDQSTTQTTQLNSAVQELKVMLSNCPVANQAPNCNLIQFYMAGIKTADKRSFGQQYLMQATRGNI